jgi:hypothetical protein
VAEFLITITTYHHFQKIPSVMKQPSRLPYHIQTFKIQVSASQPASLSINEDF